MHLRVEKGRLRVMKHYPNAVNKWPCLGIHLSGPYSPSKVNKKQKLNIRDHE